MANHTKTGQLVPHTNSASSDRKRTAARRRQNAQRSQTVVFQLPPMSRLEFHNMFGIDEPQTVCSLRKQQNVDKLRIKRIAKIAMLIDDVLHVPDLAFLCTDYLLQNE